MTVRDEHGGHGPQPANRRWLVRPRMRLVLILVLGIALVAMFVGYRQAIIGGNVVAIALVAACLVLHPLMHRGHGGHRGTSQRRTDQP